MEEPLLELKSKYRIIYEFVNRHMLNLIVLIGLSFGLIRTDVYILFLVIIGMYIVYIIGYTFYNVKKYNYTTYYFYEKNIVYERGILKKDEQVIFYDAIVDMRYKQTLLQTFLKTGNIYFYVDTGNILKSSICLYGISNVQENYEKIQKIILKSRVEG